MRFATTLVLVAAVLCNVSYAQSNLPRCQGDFAKSTWHNCYGILRLPSGNRYEGEFRDDYPNGRGISFYVNGNRYEGEWRDGKKDGRGIYYYANGDRYEGEFRDDKRNGRAIYYHANGDRHEGEWRDDKRNGRAIYYHANGDRYEGEWRDGERNGRGIFYNANGKTLSGYWVDGKYAGAAPPAVSPSNTNTNVATNKVKMSLSGGTYTIPVRLNDQLTLDFTVDSGASVVTVPADVVRTLIRTKTIISSDFRGEQVYVLADGSETKSRNFILRRLTVGNQTVENVEATIADVNGSLLLGQSFLRKFKSWSINNASHELILQ